MDISSIFYQVLIMSVFGSILGIAVLIVKSVFKYKLSARIHYFLWFILLIKLVIPLNFQSYVNPINFIHIDNKNSKTLVVQANNLVKISALTQGISTKKQTTKGINSTATTKTIASDNKWVTFQNIIKFIPAIWLAVAMIIFAYVISINLFLFFHIKKQKPIASTEISNIVQECKSKLNIKRKVSIVYYNQLIAPAVYGLISPKILISLRLLDRLSYRELRYILLHELTHVKQKDLLINAVVVFLQCLYWFNPFIWYLLHKLKQDCEIACDAYVLKALQFEERNCYGQTIIDMLKISSNRSLALGTIGFSTKFYKRRLIMISKFNKKSIIASATSIIIVFGICFSVSVGIQTKAGVVKKHSNNILINTPIKTNIKETSSKRFKSYFKLLGLTKNQLTSKLKEKPVKVDEGGVEFKAHKLRIWFDSKALSSQVLVMDKTVSINSVKIGESIEKFKKVFGKPTKSKNGEVHFKYDNKYLIVDYDTATQKTIAVYILNKDY